MPGIFVEHRRRGPGVLLALCALCLWQAPAQAGTTVEEVRKRGELRCGVSSSIPGFAERDDQGRWHGLEPDFCRAVAAAVLGDAGRVAFVPLAAPERFPALLTRRVDLLLANTTWTLSREALLGVRFPATLLHDGQSFMVPSGSSAQDPQDLAGATICVERETSHSERLRALAAQAGLEIQPLPAESAGAAAEAFFAGRCAALSAEASQLAALRLRAGKASTDFRIMARAISREPTGPVVRADDDAWETVVRWVAAGLFIAEESGIDATSAASGRLPAFTPAWGVTNEQEFTLVADALGVAPGWLLRSVSAVGNYGEIYERNLGKGSTLGLERGPNRLWQDGGLMYAPPLK